MKSLKKLTAMLLVFAFAVCMLTACGGGNTPAAPSETPTDPEIAAVIAGINEVRKANGKNELSYTSALDATAQHTLETYQKYQDEVAAGNYQHINAEWNSYYSTLQKTFTINGQKATHKGGLATMKYTTDFSSVSEAWKKDATHVGVAIGEVNGEKYMTIHFATLR